MSTINEVVLEYLESIKISRSWNTFLTYRNAMNNFCKTISNHDINIDINPPSIIREGAISWFASDLKNLAATTEQLYLTAVKGFYDYLVSENISTINLPKVKLLIKQRSRRPGKRLPQFPAESISKLLEYYNNKNISTTDNKKILLRELRDKAFLVTLADTGLRVNEACSLRCGDIDWNEGKALIIGKGNKQAIVRFSRSSQESLRTYLQARSKLDRKSGHPLTSLPLFARHDKGAGKKVKPITPTTGRNIIAARVKEALGEEAVGTITPHSFRHYFVTKILLTTKNLKLAQSLARHQNIAVTQRYAHLSDDELDKGYWQVFEED